MSIIIKTCCKVMNGAKQLTFVGAAKPCYCSHNALCLSRCTKMDEWKMYANAVCFNKLDGVLSGPVASWQSSSCRSFVTPSIWMSTSGISGSWFSLIFGICEMSSQVKTETKWLLSRLSLDRLSVYTLPKCSRAIIPTWFFFLLFINVQNFFAHLVLSSSKDER